VLRAVSGTYSSHPTALLSLAARVPGFDLTAYRGIDETRCGVRVPAMRRSKYLLATELAATYLSATRVPLEQHHWRLVEAGVPPAEYLRWRDRVLEALQVPLTARAVRRALLARGADVPHGLPKLLATMTYDGSLLRTGGRSTLGDQVEYVATAAWLGAELPDVDRTEAVRTVVELYLRSHGPVRPADIAWWTASSQRQARQVLRDLGAVDVGGEYFATADHADALLDANVPDALDDPLRRPVVLPPWDGYVMGYAPDGRQRICTPEAQQQLFDSAGNSLGAVLGVDGLMATWTLHRRDAGAVATLRPLDRCTSYDAAVERLEAFGAVLGCEVTVVTKTDAVPRLGRNGRPTARS